MILELPEVEQFASCPAFYQKSINDPLPTLDKRTDTFLLAIQKAYFAQMKGMKPPWRRLMGWVDKTIFKGIDISNEEQIEKGRKLSESILLPLRKWYEEEFIKEQVEGYINVPIDHVTKGHLIKGIIPLLKLTDPPTITIVGNVVQNRFQLYNNWIARGLAWMVGARLKLEKVNVQYIYLGPSHGIDYTNITCSIVHNRRTGRRIRQIANSIQAHVNYPSFTSMCNSCKFRQECLL